MNLSFRILVCLTAAAITFYAYIEKSNELTELRLAIPKLAKELRTIQSENEQLQYEIDRFESPLHLMELSRKPEFGHLKYPYLNEVLIVEEAL